ncbi:MAG: radical SAM protein, partial [Candidatus Omnitrophica bacterium]|nr:radical SAM protein [Candidatus Omnitrophota bacterium]
SLREFWFFFLNESENSFVEFVDKIANGKDDFTRINGIAYLKNSEVCWQPPELIESLNDMVFPSIDVIEGVNYDSFPYPLLTSRGCPYGCIFCCVGISLGKKWRPRLPLNVIAELENAKRKFGFSQFEILDDNFTFDLERAKEICSLIIEKKLNMSWYCHNGIRADKIDNELADLMKKAGCQSCALGIETADPKVFENIKKGESLEDISRAVKIIKEAGMKTVGYFIIGLPHDSFSSVIKTIEFQNSLGLDDFMYNIAVAYPGTKLWEYVKQNGSFLMDVEDVSHFSDDVKIPFETAYFTQIDRKRAYNIASVQIENQALKIKNFLSSKKVNQANNVFMGYFDELRYRIIRTAYPDTEIIVFSSLADWLLIKQLSLNDHNLFHVEAVGTGSLYQLSQRLKPGNVQAAFISLRGLLEPMQMVALLLLCPNVIIIHRLAKCSKSFQSPICLNRIVIFCFFIFDAFVLVIVWVFYVYNNLKIKISNLFKRIR